MELKALNYTLTILGFAGHVLLMIVLVRRRIAMRLPLFTILVMFYLLRSGMLLLANFKGLGAGPFWVMIALDPALQCILYATIVGAWWPSDSRPPLGLLSLVAVAMVLSGFAAWYIGPSSHFSPENLAIKAGVFISVLWTEAGLALAAASAGLLRQLPKFARTVVQGFVIYSTANVITDIGHMHFARIRAAHPYVELSYMRIVAYLVCLAWWIVGFSREARIPAASPAAYVDVT